MAVEGEAAEAATGGDSRSISHYSNNVISVNYSLYIF